MSNEPKISLIRTCALATGLTMNEVEKIAYIGPKRYKVYQIPKRSGGQRTICHPSRELKALQYIFLRKILDKLPIHDAATAYKAGSSIKINASSHLLSRVILKLDFENFFPSIKVEDWVSYAKENLPHWSERDIEFSSRVMFWGAGGYKPVCLSIGAPTSPLLSNALMFQFDSLMSLYAIQEGLIYTRYADDITISTKGQLKKNDVLSTLHLALSSIKYPILKLNQAKTRLISKSNSRRVTGLVLSNDGSLSLGRDRKRLISSMVDHVVKNRADQIKICHLAGLLSFASDIEPNFVLMLRKKYGDSVVESLKFGQVIKD